MLARIKFEKVDDAEMTDVGECVGVGTCKES